MKPLVVVPVCNRRANIRPLVAAVLAVDPAIHLLVVDDASADGSGDLADTLARSTGRMHVLHTVAPEGIGAARIAGFRYALAHDYTHVVAMDIDFAHRAEPVARLLQATQSADVAIASSSLGGSAADPSAAHHATAGSGRLRADTPFYPPIKDYPSGFACFRRAALRKLPLGDVRSNGQGFQVEISYLCYRAGLRMVEIPVANRTAGRLKNRAAGRLHTTRQTVASAHAHAWTPRRRPTPVQEELRASPMLPVAQPAIGTLTSDSGRAGARSLPGIGARTGSQMATAQVQDRKAGFDVRAAFAQLQPASMSHPAAVGGRANQFRLAEPAPASLRARARRLILWLVAHTTPERAVVTLAVALSIMFYAWYAGRGLTMAYSDAVSHFMIARRVLDSRTPGLGEFGSTWLPLTHLLMLPLIWITWLWRDGFAGSFPSMVAYVIGSLYMYRLAHLLFSSRAAGLVGALAFMLNPSMLYMQATALTEVALNAAIVVAVYYAASWAQTSRPADLVLAAAGAAAATLVRFDGWAVAGALAGIVIYVSWRRGGRSEVEAHALLFGTLGFAGCAAWALYNQVIFGNALYFLSGPTSAHAQFLRQPAPTYHKLWLSAHVYGQAVLDTCWWPLVVVAAVGLVFWALSHRLDIHTLPAYALLMPFAFNWLSMVIGISGMRVPGLTLGPGNDTYFNGRLALVMMPAVALFLAFLASRHRALLVTVLALTVLFAGDGSLRGTPYALEDPLHGLMHSVLVLDPAAGKWLGTHYRGGNVLISGAAFEPLIFYSGLPDHAFITDADAVEFPPALAQPQRWVTWIVMASQSANVDLVWSELQARHDWRRYFVLRAVMGSDQFYERRPLIGSV